MIKNIIFDLCGPIITLDLEMMNRRFHDYGITVGKPYQKLRDEGLTKDFEQGIISSDDFCGGVRRVLQCNLADGDIFDCWNTVVADFPAPHAELLARLHKRYRLFLLSNSDVVNARHFCDYANSHAGYDLFGTVFDKVFFSCHLRLRKPSTEIFTTIMEKENLTPSETLFVDDCQKHTLSAASLGINVIWLRPGWDIADLFDDKLDVIAGLLG